jgi:hypothetical protein
MRKEQRGRQDKNRIHKTFVFSSFPQNAVYLGEKTNSHVCCETCTRQQLVSSSKFKPLRCRYFAISNFFTSTWIKLAFLRNHVRSQIKWQETCRSKYKFRVLGVCPEFMRQTLHWGRTASDSTNHTSCLQNDDNLKCAQIHNSSVIKRSYFFSYCTHSSVI